MLDSIFSPKSKGRSLVTGSPSPGCFGSWIHKRSLATAVVIVNSVLISGRPATAEDQPAPAASPNGASTASNPQDLPEVDVSAPQPGYKADDLSLSKFTEPLLTTPQTATVVTTEVMQDQAVTTLRDSLRNVSGISIGAGEGSYQGDNVTIRGFSARSDIFIDGMRDFGSYFRDPFNIQAVEVLKGPSSTEFGRGSTGGAINMDTKTPTLPGFVAGSLTYGTDDTKRETIDVDEPIPGVPNAAFRINAMDDIAHVTGRDVTSFNRWGIAPTLAFGLGTDTRITISYFHQTENDVPDYGLPWYFDRPPPVPLSNFYGFKSDFMKTDVNLGTLKIEHDFNDHFTLREHLRVSDSYRDFRITEPQLPDDATPQTPISQQQVERNIIDGISTERSIDESIEADIKFSTGEIKHHIVAGIEYVHESTDPRRIEPGWEDVPNTSLLNPNENQVFTGVGPLSNEVNASVNTLAAYAIDTMKLGQSWTLIGGLRFDRISSEYEESITPKSAFGAEDQALTWRAALVWQPKPNGSVYLAAGTSIHPNVEQLSISSESTLPANTADIATGMNIDVELGTKWQFFDNRLSLTGALFWDEQTNPAAEDADEPLLLVLNGKERVVGFELGAVGHVTDQWQVLVNYTFQDSDIISANMPGYVGNPIAYTPKQSLAVWTTYDLPWKFQIGAGANAVTTRTGGEQTDPTNGLLMEVPGYVIYNAMLKYRITDKVSLQLNVANLANKGYYDGIHYGHIVPGEGRTFFISTNFKF